MTKYRYQLPQLAGDLFLTDAGIETYLMFQRGLDLPHLAAFTLLRDEAGRQELRDYFEHYLAIAAASGVGLVLESPTWRANPDWGERLGYTRAGLAAANRDAIGLMRALRDAHESPGRPMPISGCVGPRHDAYDPERFMSKDEAQDYHAIQVETFAGTEADLVTAVTMAHA